MGRNSIITSAGAVRQFMQLMHIWLACTDLMQLYHLTGSLTLAIAALTVNGWVSWYFVAETVYMYVIKRHLNTSK